MGPLSADGVRDLRAAEQAVHGWDVATAVGAAFTLADDVVDPLLAFSRTMIENLPPDRHPFGDPVPVPAGAPAFDRLLGLLGRDPNPL